MPLIILYLLKRNITFHDKKSLQTYEFIIQAMNDLYSLYAWEYFWIFAGLCIYLSKKRSQIEAYDCIKFEHRCPDKHYRGSQIFKCKHHISSFTFRYVRKIKLSVNKRNRNLWYIGSRVEHWTFLFQFQVQLFVTICSKYVVFI